MQSALEGLWDHAQVEEWTASIVGSGTREAAILDGLVRMTFGAGLNDSDLNAAMSSLWADAYQAGALAAAQQLGREFPPGWDPTTMDKAPSWADWKPGMDASLVTRDGGWASAISEAGVTIKGMGEESLRLVSSAIESGVASGATVRDIAKGIRSTVASSDRAELIAHTESARMLTRASVYQYQAAGVQAWDLVISGGACRTCVDVASTNPHMMGDRGAMAPVHPRCRCAVSPAAGYGPARNLAGASYPSFTPGLPAADDAAAADAAGASRAAEYTYESTEHLTDLDLANLMGELYETDPAAADKIGEILDERDKRGAALTTEAGWGTAPSIQESTNPVANPAARTARKLTERERIAEEYDQYALGQYQKALEELNGVLLNDAGKAYARSTQPDLEWLIFRGPWQVANKYASEELQQWWLENGRETGQSFRYAVTHYDSDRRAAELVRLRGHSRSAGGPYSDRSQF